MIRILHGFISDPSYAESKPIGMTTTLSFRADTCYACVTGRMEEAKERLRRAINFDKDIRGLALDESGSEALMLDWIGGLE